MPTVSQTDTVSQILVLHNKVRVNDRLWQMHTTNIIISTIMLVNFTVTDCTSYICLTDINAANNSHAS